MATHAPDPRGGSVSDVRQKRPRDGRSVRAGEDKIVAQMGQRRGRRSHEALLEAAMDLFRLDLVALDGQERFAECRGVLTLSEGFLHDTFRQGAALQVLLQGAVADVCSDLFAAGSPYAGRLAHFLQRWFFEHRTVREIAAELQLNPHYAGRAIKTQACALSAQRFLALAYSEDPVTLSPGVQEAMRLHKERRPSIAHLLAGTTSHSQTSLLSSRTVWGDSPPKRIEPLGRAAFVQEGISERQP